jgi:diguanylate cyclase
MFFKRDEEKKELAWKNKYYDTLDKLDKREKEWARLEHSMRTAMSRLSVAIEGVSTDLDKELDYLRRSIRKGVDGDKLSAQIQRIIPILDQVEKQKAKQKSVTVPVVMQKILDEIDLPPALARKEKAFRKDASRYTEKYDPAPLIPDFIELLSLSFNALRKESASGEKKSSQTEKTSVQEKGAEKQKEEVKAETEARVESTSTSVGSVDLAATHDLSGRHVMERLLGVLAVPEEQDSAVNKIRKQIGSVKVEKELNRLAEELAVILNEAFPVKPDEVQQVDSALTEHDLSINEVLLQLLERIELPRESSDEMKDIQVRLEGEVGEKEWPDLLEKISRLISSMKESVQKEKKSIEEFLSQLTERLQELDVYMGGFKEDHDESIQYGKDLGDKVREHVEIMQSSIQEVSELDQLKEVVFGRLQTIAEHMESFRKHEEERDQRADERIQQLNEKIRVMEDESETLRKKVRKERQQALLDQLTEVYNRLAYDERIEQEYSRWKRYRAPLSLLVIDIDFFKKINDTYGHIAGDKVLHTLAQLLKKSIRETDFLARYGGEEFVIIMPDTAAKEGLGVAEKLRSEVENCGFHYREEKVPITISSGVSEFRENDSPDIVFERADTALYKSKAEGRNRCTVG